MDQEIIDKDLKLTLENRKKLFSNQIYSIGTKIYLRIMIIYLTTKVKIFWK